MGREIARVVFDEETIARRVAELGSEITGYYDGEDLQVIGLLKGSFIFVADLVRKISRPHKVDFLVVVSYGTGKVTSGAVRLLYDPETQLLGKHILLVEDIVDSGNTLNHVCRLIRKRHPKSLAACTLLHKRKAPDLVVEPRFVGFDAPHAFLVGYGLDHAEEFRHLPHIGTIEE